MADALCELCEEYYNDPRMLPRLHSFCLKCLEKRVDTQDSMKTLHCPNCEEQVNLSNNRLSDLPHDLYKANEATIARINDKVENAEEHCEACGRNDDTGKAVAYCSECAEHLCKFCEGRHRKRAAEHRLFYIGQRNIKTNEASQYQPKMFCETHTDYVLDLYCKQCDKLICKYCMAFDHADHHKECDLLNRVAGKEMEGLCGRESEVNGAVAAVTRAITSCHDMVKQVEKNKRELRACVNSSLEHVKEALLAHVDDTCSGKVEGLKTQAGQLQQMQDGLSLASKLIALAPSQSPAQQLSTNTVISERVAKLMGEFERAPLTPSRDAAVSTHIADNISKMIVLGCISGGCHPASSTCDVGYVPYAVIGKLRTVKVVARNKKGSACSYSGEKVIARLVSSHGSTIHAEPTDNGDGTYSTSFTPQNIGAHELHVTIAYQDIKCSPFQLHVAQSRSTHFTELQLSVPHSFTTNDSPYDVAVTDEGLVAVAEYKNQTVTLYSERGQKKMSFGTAKHCGNGEGELHLPSAVAVRRDFIYVCDSGNSRVQKFSIGKESFVSKFGRGAEGPGKIGTPTGICIDPEGKVFVADMKNDCIHVFCSDDSFAFSFPCTEKPWGLAFDRQGQLHVAAHDSHCVRVLTSEGTSLSEYGSDTLSCPTGIAIDAQGCIAVSEGGTSNRFVIFNPDHTFCHVVSGQFGGGRGIVCDKDGFFWVADSSNNCVSKY